MRVVAIVLAVDFFVLGILYGMGKINFFTRVGRGHAHHITHLVILWVLALLCLIWARFPKRAAVKPSHIARRRERRDGRRFGKARHVRALGLAPKRSSA